MLTPQWLSEGEFSTLPNTNERSRAKLLLHIPSLPRPPPPLPNFVTYRHGWWTVYNDRRMPTLVANALGDLGTKFGTQGTSRPVTFERTGKYWSGNM